jgi:protoporphyrinogen oxidase
MQARRRVAADSPVKLLRKVFGRLPGVKPLGFRHFLYPRRGFGQISEAFALEAKALGAELRLGWRADAIRLPREPAAPIQVSLARNGKRYSLEGQFLWSTIPLTILARIASPEPPPEVRHAAEQLEFRAMLLVYLTLEVDRFSEYDAHYFPGEDVLLTRLSEPKNYAGSSRLRGRTTLCAEIPCSTADAVWKMTDEQLGALVTEDLTSSGIPLPAPPARVEVRKLRQAYPTYLRGYERVFSVLDRWVETQPRLLSFGRQGLFAHDNTHHALHMAYSAVDCLGPDGFDHNRWREYRTSFERHVVED